MKELFREADFAIAGYSQSVLESMGILTHIRNESLQGAGRRVPDISRFAGIVREVCEEPS